MGQVFLRPRGETISWGFQRNYNPCVLMWSSGMRTEDHPGFGQLGFISNLRESQLCATAGGRASFHRFNIEPRGML